MSTHSLTLTNEKTLRDYAMLFNARHYPNVTPRDDADIVILAHRLYEGPESDIYDYLTHIKTAQSFPELSASESIPIAINASTKLLATPLPSEVAGLKPEAIERPIPGLFTSPIPDTDYSLQIWAGPAWALLYNMDFIHTATGLPVNSPFEFKLFAVGSIYAPWATLGSFPMEVHSGEATFAAGQEILHGEEKFFLVNGGHYALVHPGKRDVLFSVPQCSSTTPPPNGDVLNFPSFI